MACFSPCLPWGETFVISDVILKYLILLQDDIIHTYFCSIKNKSNRPWWSLTCPLAPQWYIVVLEEIWFRHNVASCQFLSICFLLSFGVLISCVISLPVSWLLDHLHLFSTPLPAPGVSLQLNLFLKGPAPPGVMRDLNHSSYKLHEQALLWLFMYTEKGGSSILTGWLWLRSVSVGLCDCHVTRWGNGLYFNGLSSKSKAHCARTFSMCPNQVWQIVPLQPGAWFKRVVFNHWMNHGAVLALTCDSL